MRIVYITPRINDAGGLCRVISMKANYLTDVLGHEIHILTHNNGNTSLFYDFSDKIVLHDMILNGNRIQYFYQYIKEVEKHLKLINPDIVIVCDGYKGFFLPWFMKNEKPIIFESHGSIHNNEKGLKDSFFNKMKFQIESASKRFLLMKFQKLIVLSKESSEEWKVSNALIIPNPVWNSTSEISTLNNKKAISVSRHSYEKGIDRLLLVWKEVLKKYPDWTLDIYGDFDKSQTYQKLADELEISTGINFFEPVRNIREKYIDASMYLMTSRFEGFPMVLLEAMDSGLPCVAFDCPCGLKSLIQHNSNGLLIENGDIDGFVNSVVELIENEAKRKELAVSARKSIQKYNLDEIMKLWVALFNDLVSRNEKTEIKNA